MKNIRKQSLLLLSFLWYSISIFPQGVPSAISEGDKLEVIRKAISLLHENYIFPERVSKIEGFVLNKYQTKGYTSLNNPQDFLTALNRDLEEQSGDKHINVSFGPDRVLQIKKENESAGKEQPITAEWLQRLQYENFRMRKLEWLDGNIGYLRFLNFPDLGPAKETITGAMNFIRNSFAIIIDLRDNGGGSSETLKFILSYFLKDGLKLGEYRFRKDNRVEENIIRRDPSVLPIPDHVPVYILVSNRTASAAEGMASILQGLGRAVIVGEKTKGEGNPGELFVINELLYMMIPTAISVSAIPNTKPVEGSGVTPDINTSPAKAQDIALLEVCKRLSKEIPVKQLQKVYEWQIPYLEYKTNPVTTPFRLVNGMTGNYKDGRKIIKEKDALVYIGKDNKKLVLTYYGNNIFGMEGKEFVRIRVPASDNRISSFEFIWDDGFTEKIIREN